MSKFNYVAITTTGQRLNGSREGDSKDEVVNYLISKGMTVVDVEEDLSGSIRKFFSMDIGGVPLADRLVLVKQLSTMIGAGVPIIQAIDILVQQTEKPGLKEKLQNVYKAIEAGTSLSEAFAKEKGLFTEVQINLLAAGEKSGNLNEMLLQVATDMEKSKDLRGKVTGAMIYPAIIFVVMIIIMLLMVIFMVPQVSDLYKSLGQNELPFVTQVLVNISGFFTNIFSLALTLIFLITMFVTYRYYSSTEGGKRVIGKIKLKIPIFGNLMQKIETVQFCRLTAMLIQSGVPIIETLGIVAKAMGNPIFQEIISQSKEEVTKGATLALAIAKYNQNQVFPIILIKIISTGEETGKLDKVLEDMSKFYESEVEQITSNLTKLMEPFILVVVGGMVGFLAVSIYLPLYQVGQYIK